MEAHKRDRVETPQAAEANTRGQKPGERCLRPTEAADRLNCSRSQVYELIASGQLSAFRLAGRSIRISESQLDEFIARMIRQHAVVQREQGNGDVR